MHLAQRALGQAHGSTAWPLYTLKYVVKHLVEAMAVGAGSGADMASTLLDELLRRYDFLDAVLRARLAGRIIADLLDGDGRASMSEFSSDTTSFVRCMQHRMTGADDSSSFQAAYCAPFGTPTYKAAEYVMAQNLGCVAMGIWTRACKLGESISWPPSEVTLQVRNPHSTWQ